MRSYIRQSPFELFEPLEGRVPLTGRSPRRLALALVPVLLLAAAPALAFDLTPNSGTQGQTLIGVLVTTSPLIAAGASVTFSPGGNLTAFNLRNDSGGFLLFDLNISPISQVRTYAGMYTGPSGTISNPSAFTVLGTLQTPTPLPPTPTLTPTPTRTPTATPPGATPTPTRTPVFQPTPLPGGFAIAPDTIAEGARGVLLVIAGAGFGPGTSVQAPDDIFLERTTVLSATRLEIVVSNRLGTQSGPRTLFVSTPGGPSGSVRVTVVPARSLGAPLSVRTAAIVFPRPGTFLAPADQVFPRALLAVTGSGSVTGSWTLDGTPYERFDIVVAGGEPQAVEARTPIPIAPEGDHFLGIAFDHPQAVESEPVLVLRVQASAARLRLIEPGEGALAPRRRLFRWTLVPGAQSYEVVFSREERELPDSPRFRSTQGRFRPTAEQWKRIGEGVWYWAVRAILPVDVRGPLSGWRRLEVPPERVSLRLNEPALDPATGDALLAWSGGSRGLLYRLSFAQTQGDSPERPVFSALTFSTRYRLDESVNPGDSVTYRVEALLPGGMVLGSSEPRRLPPRVSRPRGRIARARSPALVSSYAPSDGASVATAYPKIAATFRGRADPGEILLLLDGMDVTPVASLREGGIVLIPPLPLAPGRHVAALQLGESVTRWEVVVAPSQTPPSRSSAPGPASGEEELVTAPPDWKVDLGGIVTVKSGGGAGEEDTAHLTLSTSVSFLRDAWSLDGTVDLAGHHQLEPTKTVQDSRSWVVNAEGGSARWNAAGMVGYSPPTAGEGLQLLSPGFARGGGEVRLTTPLGRVSGYQTFDEDLGGLFSSDYFSGQRLRMGSYELPLPRDRILVRGVYLDVEDKGRDFGAPAQKGKVYGGFGRWVAGPGLTVVVEGARSESDAEGEGDSGGNAWRLNLQGLVGQMRYVFNLHQADGEFLNPANRGLTSSGQPDKRGGDVGLSWRLGKWLAGASYRLLESEANAALGSSKNRSHAGTVTLGRPLSKAVMATGTGFWTEDSGDAAPGVTGPLPKVDRAQYGGQLILWEVLGRFSLSETFSFTRFDDRVSSANDVDTTGAQLAASGYIGSTLGATVSAGFTRSKRALSGNNDSLVLLIQPRWTILPLRITLTPRASYSRGKSDASPLVSSAEQYQALVHWTALRLGRFEAILGAAGDWTRFRFGPADPGFTRRWTGTLTIRWGAGSEAAGAPALPASFEWPNDPFQRIPVAALARAAWPGRAGLSRGF